ncbi:hypothetical protein [Sporolituus thermophilus]|uniref:Uncharacterized protein n=1 Tax=Sporolituus thermophilus DSM 23256 TaxID=1123285 RepID=A0A1G7N4C8_9FIRM|nr:hypothetical protein [Sporolituus thermophilus]SDF68190.1 hypothetical protein SAMN05660235_02393 [Sporolituus thermophilus DSM 23256]
MHCMRLLRYTLPEMLDRFAGGKIYYSRFPKLKIHRRSWPDHIALYDFEDRLAVVTAIYDNSDVFRSLLEPAGFTYESGPISRWYKETNIPFRPDDDPLAVFTQALKAIEEAAANAPILMYASGHLAGLQSYLEVLSGRTPTLTDSELLAMFGGSLWQLNAATESLPGPLPWRGMIEIDNGNITRLPDGRWGAWFSGDALIPVFTSRDEALRFMQRRQEICGRNGGEKESGEPARVAPACAVVPAGV